MTSRWVRAPADVVFPPRHVAPAEVNRAASRMSCPRWAASGPVVSPAKVQPHREVYDPVERIVPSRCQWALDVHRWRQEAPRRRPGIHRAVLCPMAPACRGPSPGPAAPGRENAAPALGHASCFPPTHAIDRVAPPLPAPDARRLRRSSSAGTAGSGTAGTKPFSCGSATCPGSDYCDLYTPFGSPTGGDQAYRCSPIPAACASQPTCACFVDGNLPGGDPCAGCSGGSCSDDGEGHVTIACSDGC